MAIQKHLAPYAMFLLILCPTLAVADEQQEMAKNIVASLDSQKALRVPVLIKYRFDVHYKPGMFSGETKPSSESRNSKGLDITAHCEMALKGSRSYMKRDGPINDGGVAKNVEPIVFVFDGKNSYENVFSRYKTSSKHSPHKVESPWTINGQDDARRSLENWATGDFNTGRAKSDVIVRNEKGPKGEPLLRLERVPKVRQPGWVIWLLPELEYALFKKEVYDPDGSLLRRYDQCTYQVIDKKVFPKSGVWTLFGKDANGKPEVSMRYTLNVESIETDPSKIPDSLFQMDIPKDKPVIDMDTKTIIADPKAIQEHLDRLASEVPGRRQREWWPAILGVVVLAVAVVGLTYWLRRRNRSRQA
jgi:hypothetical protein